MMTLYLIVCIILFVIIILIAMAVIVKGLRIKKVKRDKVVTRTGGLSHDRIYEKIDMVMDDMEENRS